MCPIDKVKWNSSGHLEEIIQLATKKSVTSPTSIQHSVFLRNPTNKAIMNQWH